MVKTRYVRTNKRKVFKEYYLLGSCLSFLAIFSALSITYKDKELSRAQWRGTFLGGIQLPAIFILWNTVFLGLFNAPANIAVFALIVMVIAYVAYLIAFALNYVTE